MCFFFSYFTQRTTCRHFILYHISHENTMFHFIKSYQKSQKYHLWDIKVHHLRIFSSFFKGRQLLLTGICSPKFTSHPKKGLLLKKEFAPFRSKFFPLRVAPNEKRGKYFHFRIMSFEGASILFETLKHQLSGPSCSKLTMLLVNDSLKF